MEQINDWKDKTIESLLSIWQEVISVLPSILGAIAILFFGWLFSKIVVKIISRALKFAKADKLDDKLNDIELFGDKKLNFNIIKIVTSFVKWALLLVFLIIAADILNWTIISEEVGNLLHYIPQLFSAIALFLIGLFIANFIKKSLYSFFKSLELSGGKLISQLVFMIIVIFISITALNQAGINTEIITSNITLILGAFLAAFALALGLGSKEIVGDLLKAFYTRKTFEIGQKIKFKNVEGEIVSVNNISMTLKTASGTLIVPIKEVVDNQVNIQE